jgi:hypothetical protein
MGEGGRDTEEKKKERQVIDIGRDHRWAKA